MKRVFMFGYYGFRNIGDEAILEAIVGQFREVMPQVTLTALSYHAEETSHRYGIEAVSRNHFLEVIRSIRKSDLVMSGGGSILQDVTSSRSLMYYLGIILLAKILRKKVAFYGNGFGPITRPINQYLVKYIINRVDLLTVRDDESCALMRQMGIHRPIHITADAAFTLTTQSQKKLTKQQTPPRVGISVRRWKNQPVYLPVIAACADALICKGYEIYFIPMQTPSDTKVSAEIIEMMKGTASIIDTGDTPGKMIEFISEMEFIIGMRLHSLVFSAIAGVPMIGLSYEAKITSFLKRVEQPCAGNVETLTEEQMMNTLDDFLHNMEEYQCKVRLQQTILKDRAVENTKMVQAFLWNGETAS